MLNRKKIGLTLFKQTKNLSNITSKKYFSNNKKSSFTGLINGVLDKQLEKKFEQNRGNLQSALNVYPKDIHNLIKATYSDNNCDSIFYDLAILTGHSFLNPVVAAANILAVRTEFKLKIMSGRNFIRTFPGRLFEAPFVDGYFSPAMNEAIIRRDVADYLMPVYLYVAGMGYGWNQLTPEMTATATALLSLMLYKQYKIDNSEPRQMQTMIMRELSTFVHDTVHNLSDSPTITEINVARKMDTFTSKKLLSIALSDDPFVTEAFVKESSSTEFKAFRENKRHNGVEENLLFHKALLADIRNIIENDDEDYIKATRLHHFEGLTQFNRFLNEEKGLDFRAVKHHFMSMVAKRHDAIQLAEEHLPQSFRALQNGYRLRCQRFVIRESIVPEIIEAVKTKNVAKNYLIQLEEVLNDVDFVNYFYNTDELSAVERLSRLEATKEALSKLACFQVKPISNQALKQVLMKEFDKIKEQEHNNSRQFYKKI